MRCFSNAFLEGPFFTRLSSLLESTHGNEIRDGLGLSSDSTGSLVAARNELAQQIGLSNSEGLAPEVYIQ